MRKAIGSRGAGCALLLAIALQGSVAIADPPGVIVTRFTNGANAYGDANPCWAPNGSRIMYDSRDMSQAYPSLFYKDLPAGGEVQFTGSGEPTPDYEHPYYCPDGTVVAYSKKDGMWSHLYSRPATGGSETPVTSGVAGPSVDFYYGDLNPSWSWDLQWIAFASSRGDLVYGFFDIWIVKPNGTGLQRLTTSSYVDTGWPTWTPDGNHIFFSGEGDLYEITRIGAAWGAPVLRVVNGDHPRVSPDGKNVAFNRSGDIWVYTIAEGALIQITSGTDVDEDPAWSPDSKKIAFSSNRMDGNRAIWIASGFSTVPTVPTTLGRLKDGYR